MPTINDYINTGILEAYCMGIISKSEQFEVEKLCSMNEVIQAEVNAIQYTLEEYANSFSKMPPPHLKNKILSSINQLDSNTPKGRRRRQ